MARVKYVEGVQCVKCGNVIASLTIWTPELCQECGAHIIDKDIQSRGFTTAKYGKSVTVKVTSKLFTESYEVVE